MHLGAVAVKCGQLWSTYGSSGGSYERIRVLSLCVAAQTALRQTNKKMNLVNDIFIWQLDFAPLVGFVSLMRAPQATHDSTAQDSTHTQTYITHMEIGQKIDVQT